MLTNTPPLQPFRGAGRPEAAYLIEQLIDRAARVIGVDPIEIRRRNFIPPIAMPHKLHSGIAYDSGEFMRVMDECLKLADWSGFPTRGRVKKQGKLRGRGIGFFIEEAAIFNDRMVHPLRPERHGDDPCRHPFARPRPPDRLRADGARMARRPDRVIHFVQGDTNEVAVGRGTYGSRSMHVGGNALKRAADAIIEKAKPMAAMMLEAAANDLEFKDGAFHIVGTRPVIAVGCGGTIAAPADVPAAAIRRRPEASGTFAAEPSNYPNGCHACEVEIDRRRA